MNNQMDVTTTPAWHRRRGVRIAVGAAAAVTTAVVASLLIMRAGQPTLELDQIVIATVQEEGGALELRAAGELARQRRIPIQASADGTVRSIDVEPGSSVRTGTRLAVLTNVDLELAARTASAELEVARAELSSTDARLVGQLEAQRMELARAKAELSLSTARAKGHQKLFDAGMISELALREYTSALELATMRVDIETRKLAAVQEEYTVNAQSAATRAAIMQDASDRAKERVAEMTIVAPFDGIAERFGYEAGESVSRGDDVVWFAGNSGMDAVVRVLERSAQRVKVGSTAAIIVGANRISAIVQRMDPQVENGVVKVTLRPVAALPESWLPGQRVDSMINVGSSSQGAVVRRPVGISDDSSAVVLRRSPDGSSAVATTVSFGIGSEGKVEVKSGLKPGDQIVVSDVGRLRAGEVFSLR